MKLSAVFWVLLAAASLVGGWYAQPYLQPYLKELKPEKKVEETKADTDSFSIRLFRQALSEKPQGNVLVAPHVVSDTLYALRQASAGKTLEELQVLQLREATPPRATEPAKAVLLAMDFNLPRQDGQRDAMPLPFSENVPMALSLFNGYIADAMAEPDTQLANSTIVTNRTKLLAGCSVMLKGEWEIPFHSANTRTTEFDAASGGMPHFRQMRSRGLYRCAKAGDGSWRAVALPFKKEAANGAELVYIGILPACSARHFAGQLTAEQLTTIRTMLAESEPQDTLVEIPRLELRVLPFDMRDTLRRMQLKALFDPATADFSPLTPEKIQLGGFLHSAAVNLVESAEQKQADATIDLAKECISFNSPYIWVIADLATGTPVEFIGLVEEM